MLKTDLTSGKFEFDFTDQDFDNLRKIVTEHTGIQLPPNKKSLMYSRLSRRLRVLNMNNFSSYHTHVKQTLASGSDVELMEMVNAMTTNVTHFFREPHHFDFLSENLSPLIQKFGELNIWCAASSTGEEPWSIAMVCNEFLKQNPGKSINITATDIDQNVLDKAIQGVYVLEESDVQKNPLMKKYLLEQTNIANKTNPFGGKTEKTYRVSDEIRSLISFKKLNLLKDWPLHKKTIHIVFCRNVIIYFDKETQRQIFSRMSPLMPAGSLLFIGHSESLLNVSNDYKNVFRTTYEKI